MRFFVPLLALALAGPAPLLAQSDSSRFESPYNVRLKAEIPITIAAIAAVYYGYSRLSETASLTPTEVMELDPSDVNRFDRPALDIPASGYGRAREISDYLLNGSVAGVSLLLLDRKIRANWLSFITLYGQAHMLGSGLYQSAAFPIRKARPLAYNTSLSPAERSGKNTSNSFFSGHVGSTATATFFAAKVYSDHHILTWTQKALLFTAAAIPPGLVAHYRVQGGKHFRSDVITGFLVGAATGILIPELHRKKDQRLSFCPIYGNEMKGLALSLSLP